MRDALSRRSAEILDLRSMYLFAAREQHLSSFRSLGLSFEGAAIFDLSSNSRRPNPKECSYDDDRTASGNQRHHPPLSTKQCCWLVPN